MKHNRIQFKAESFDSEQGVFTGHASVFGIVDSENDIVHPGAFRRTLAEGEAKGGVKLLLQHNDQALPIGKSLELREDEQGLYIKGYISATSSGQDVRQLVKDGILADMSIGYMPIIEDTDTNGIRNLRDVELLEISIVTNPANPLARIEGYKRQGGNRHMAKKSFKEMTPDEQEEFLTTVAEEAVQQAIEAAEDDEGKNDLDPDDEGKNDPDPDDEGKNDLDPDDEEDKGRKGKSASAKKSMFQRAAERGVKNRNTPYSYGNFMVPPNGRSEQKSKLPPGIGWVRSIKCMHQAKGDADYAARIAIKSYDDNFLSREIKALSATSPTEGGYLIPEVYAAEVIPMLYAQAVLTKLGATTIPMELGTMTIPKMTGGSSSHYVGELRKGKESQQSFGSIRLTGKKLTTKVPVSNDFLRSNTYQADQLILNEAVKQMALKMDEAGFLGKGTEFAPRGLLNTAGITRITLDDLPNESTTGRMRGELMKKNANMDSLGWAFNADVWTALYNVTNAMGLYIYRQQMDEGKLNGSDYAVANNLSTNQSSKVAQLVLGNWSDFLIGVQMDMQAEFFREGAIKGDDGEMMSAIDQDMTILRVMSIHDFGVCYPESFVIADVKTS